MSFSWVTKFYSLNHFAKCRNYVVLTGHRQGGSGLDLACAPRFAGPGLKLWKFPLPEAGIQHRGSWLEGPPGRLFASGFSGMGRSFHPGLHPLQTLEPSLLPPWWRKRAERICRHFSWAAWRCSHYLLPHSTGLKSACSQWQERWGKKSSCVPRVGRNG